MTPTRDIKTLLGPADRRDSPKDLEPCACGHPRKDHLRGFQYCFRAPCRLTCKAFAPLTAPAQAVESKQSPQP